MKALEKARKERAAATKKAEQEMKQQQDAKKRALEDAQKERAATKRKAEASVALAGQMVIYMSTIDRCLGPNLPIVMKKIVRDCVVQFRLRKHALLQFDTAEDHDAGFTASHSRFYA